MAHDNGSQFAFAWVVAKALIRGSVITVLVAWLCAMVPGAPRSHATPQMRDISAFGTEKRQFFVRSWKTWAGEMLQIERYDLLHRSPELAKADLPTWSMARGAFPSLPAFCQDATAKWWAYQEHSFGFPWLTMRATALVDVRTEQPEHVVGGIAVTRREWFIPKGRPFHLWKFVTVLPLIPVPLAFATSTLIWALPYICFFTIQQALRKRHGMCSACGYDQRGNAGAICPECGHREASPIIATQPGGVDMPQ